MPICLEVALRSDCRACFSVSALRRASSQARTSSTSFHASPLRGFNRAFTSSGFSRITRMSSITRTACTPSPRHASQMNGLPWEKRYPFTEKRCAQRHAFPNAAPFRKLPFFPCQTMIFFLLRKTVQQEDRTLHVSGNHGHPAPGCIAGRTGKEIPPVFNRRSSFHHYLFLKNPGG